jgi:hypothetical protein
MYMTSPLISDWRKIDIAEVGVTARTMLVPDELRLLYSLGRDYFRNEGYIVDAGCFLGGSTQALAHGVRANPAWVRHPREAVIYSYDFFVVEPWTIGIYFPETTPLGTSFESIYRSNIKAVADLVSVHAGNVMQASLPPGDIEVLFIDLAKHWTVNDYLVRAFFPKLIPGRSIVIQQDYLFREWNGWLPVTMEYFADYFEMIDHTEINSVAFLYKKNIPAEMLQVDLIKSLGINQMRTLANQSLRRFSGKQQETLNRSWDHFENLLKDHGWRE